MIVNATPEGWEVIYQQAHGLLAAQLAYHLKPALQCQHWIDTIIAIANHDNRQKTWHGRDGLTPAGAPADFTLLPTTLEQARELMHAVRFQSRWVTMLTSMHMSYLYEEVRGQDKATDTFLDEQQQLQESCKKSLQISPEEAKRAYAIMQWCDRLSLILCRNELPADERALEITAGPDEQVYFVKQLKNKTIQVEPWPFAQNKLTLQVEYRELKQLQFKNEKELAEALKKSAVLWKSWKIVRN
ncbi:DUF3891 family protein [Pontibacter harenae]|uniref:DUF3891 family protein n=1 Tax=Pontibacter harenae TaxID=2894083 RepID=UPI001E2C1A58|nr:DUF3891 family protein [Pontibacter harenae]MCC9166425.1 DUF3891 family protein [Pontibacter harenae]